MKKITKNTLIRFYRGNTSTGQEGKVNQNHPEWRYTYESGLNSTELLKYDFSSVGNEWEFDLWIPSHGSRNAKEIYLEMKGLSRELKLESIL